MPEWRRWPSRWRRSSSALLLQRVERFLADRAPFAVRPLVLCAHEGVHDLAIGAPLARAEIKRRNCVPFVFHAVAGRDPIPVQARGTERRLPALRQRIDLRLAG